MNGLAMTKLKARPFAKRRTRPANEFGLLSRPGLIKLGGHFSSRPVASLQSLVSIDFVDHRPRGGEDGSKEIGVERVYLKVAFFV